MVLAEPGGGVTVILQNLAHSGAILRDNRIITWVARRLLCDHTKARRVVVAAGNQGCTCGRAEGGGVELRVAQSRFRDPIHRRRRDHAAKGAGDAIALVVGHDQKHVGRAFGRDDCWRPIWFGIYGGVLDHAAKLRIGRRDLFAIDGCRRAR